MLKITEDAEHGCLVLEPEGRLTESDFDKLTETFNDKVNASDAIPNLVIHAKSFPGWADFGGLAGHVNFLRDHHKLIRKIALVSDARILDVAPQIAKHFVYADLRHFPGDGMEDALNWVAEPSAEGSAMRLIEGLPDDVLGVEVSGAVSARDYTEILIPAVEAKLGNHRRIKLLYHVTPEFKSFSPGAMWNDARVGMMNFSKFNRIALVADQDWMRNAVRLFAPLIPGEVRVFLEDEMETATAWITREAS